MSRGARSAAARAERKGTYGDHRARPRGRSGGATAALATGDAPTVALHWLVALLLLVSLATGFRVAADALEAGWWRGVAARIAPQGAVLLWHIASACALLAAAAGYVTFLVRARQVGRVRLDARQRAGLRSPDARRRWKSVNVLIYWLAFGLVFAAGTTGLLMYSDW